MRLFSKFINLLLARLMKKYLKTIVYSALTLFALFFIWLKSLDIYTANNRHIQVPDFSGVHVSDLDSAFKKNKLRYIIIDSIFDKNTDKGVVVDQSPEPNFEVKKNRRIYLTINSLQRQRVYFPEIYDLTLRQAVKKLNDNKLVVGDLEYKVDIARNKGPNNFFISLGYSGWGPGQLEEEIKNNSWINIEEETDFYFVHSFSYICDNENDILTTTKYQSTFVSAISLVKIPQTPEPFL